MGDTLVTLDQPSDLYRGDAGYMAGRRPAPLFALIIGIDDYAHYTKLRGAVADARAMAQFLEEKLQVPRDRIFTLYDNQATRDAMIKALEYLRDDMHTIVTEKGDPILIFYAGHGGELTAPEEWRLKNKIQCLIPQDCEAVGKEPIEGREPIPDRTIGALLHDIAKRKGDNITVILDCCHSASGTRLPDEYVPRNVDLDIKIPGTLDDRIWNGRLGAISDGFAYHGLRSHILLAACRERERAYERDRRGQFTRELLAKLHHCVDNKLDISYAEVLERIHLKEQHPQCEGVNRHRVLFDTRVPAGKHIFYPVEFAGGRYVISAGLAHGVAPGVEFSLYDSEKFLLGAVLIEEACAVSDFETAITAPGDLKNVSFAKLTRVGEVPIYIGTNSVLEGILRRMEGNSANVAKFRIVRELAKAKLHVKTENDQAVFEILDQRARDLGLTKLPYKIAGNNIAHILDAAAHYFWYLDRVERKNNLLGPDVTFNYYFLMKNYTKVGVPYFYHTDPSFCRRDPDLGDMIDFTVIRGGRYGIEISNNTKRDLFLNAFLFNSSSLSIIPCYTQPSAGKPEAPLKDGDTFTIGYGSTGTSPLSFSLEEGQDVDVGYLKIFFSTRHMDLCDIEQMPPFTDKHPPPTGSRRAGGNPVLPHPRDIWFTVLIPVVQRRGGEDAVVPQVPYR